MSFVNTQSPEVLERKLFVNTFAELATRKAKVGQVIYTRGHTVDGVGARSFVGVSGVYVGNDGGVTSESSSSGVYWVMRDRADLTIDDFGAIGSGLVSDKVAAEKMMAFTGGALVLNDREYYIQYMEVTAFDSVVIVGKRMPRQNADLSKLEGGSVLIGQVFVRAERLAVKNCGIDFGINRLVLADVDIGVSVTDGFVSNAKIGQLGTSATVENFAVLGESELTTTHGVLVQGYESGSVRDVYVGRHQYGVVVKCRKFNVSNISSDEIRTAVVYPKADLPAFSGDVQDATVDTCQVSNIRHRAAAGNITAAAVYVHASTEVISKIQLSNIYQEGGLSPVRLQGGGLVGSPTINNIQVSNVQSDRAQSGFFIDGYMYDVQVSNIVAVNPVTGRSVMMGQNTFGYCISGAHTVISDAAITSDICAEFYGSGVWDSISVRNNFRDMYVKVAYGSLKNIVSGRVSGDCFIQNEGSAGFTAINGAAFKAGNNPFIKINPGSVVSLGGRFDLTASANKFFCNIPDNGLNAQKIFTCGGINAADECVTVAVRLNGFQLSIEPSLPAGFKEVDLSGIIIDL